VKILTRPWRASNRAAIAAPKSFWRQDLMHKTIVIQSSGGLARKLCRDIVGEINPNYFSEYEVFGIQLAIEEALINAVEHGNQLDPLKHITVEYSITSNKFEISITDEGRGFKPDMVPDPCRDENILKVTGRGIVLMQAFMDSVEYNERGNCVHMVKQGAKAKSKT
jgi:serine/threonine-protein kinase RsbW